MFRLAQTDTFKWPVTWEIPGDGRMEKVSITAVFRRLPQSQVEAMLAGQPPITNAEAVRRVLDGWESVSGDDGQPLPFTAVYRDQLLEVTGAAYAIAVAYFEAMSGQGARKN